MSLSSIGSILAPNYSHLLHTDPLLSLLTIIRYLPTSWRKAILDFCRIQVSSNLNVHTKQLFGDIRQNESSYVHLPHGEIFSLDDLETILNDNIPHSPPIASLVAYVARAEVFTNPLEARKAFATAIEKELRATQLEDRPQLLQYSFMSGEPDPVHLEGPEDSNYPIWRKGIERFRKYFETHSQIIYPR